MNLPSAAERLRGPGARDAAGALLSLAVAFALFTRFGLDDGLKRDEAIYAYAGQQLTHGVPVYAGIFDPKTPLASVLAGLAVAVGNLLGVNDLHAMRLAYFVASCLTVVAVYLLALRLWRSALAGVLAAVVFASFRGFAMDAIAGPNAKTPGIFLSVLSMLLVVRRRWFWAAFAGSVGFLVWQPLVIYAVVAVAVAPVLSAAGERRRALGLATAGAAIPVLLVAAYFWLVGALGKLVEAAFVFPVTGIKRGQETEEGRLAHIVNVVRHGYRHSGDVFWLGLVLLLVLVGARIFSGRHDLRKTLRDPLLCVVLPTLLVIAGFSVTDFQGYPDLYPLLPYAALGLGGTAAVVVRLITVPALRQVATAGALVAVLALTALSWSWFSHDPAANGALVAQRADACALDRVVGPRGTLYALGDPTPLVLTHRRNPSRFIYLNSGVAAWHVDRTPGGFDGWMSEIESSHPAVVVLNAWKSALTPRTKAWLRATYDPAYIGPWRVFLAPGVRARAVRQGVSLRPMPPPGRRHHARSAAAPHC